MAKKRTSVVKVSGRYSIAGGLAEKFKAVAKVNKLSHDQLAEILIDNGISVMTLADAKKRHAGVKALVRLLKKLPGVRGSVGMSELGDVFWWAKFSIDLKHPLAWHVIQRLAFVLNYYSIEQKFDCKFYPASPPPDLNGGPHEYLSWVIEARVGCVDPHPIVKVLRAALPRTLSDTKMWKLYD